jgi:hypothetical protein
MRYPNTLFLKISLMKAIFKTRLQNMLGLTSQELSDVASIISEYLIYETAIDAAASLDPTLLAGLGVEVPEVTLDIIMCVKIWQYFNQENPDESNKLDFMKIIDSNPFEAAKSGILAYGITSVLKFAVGKVAGKGAFYVGSPVISGGINAVQTVTTGLLWAKHVKEKAKLPERSNKSKSQEIIIDNGKYDPVAI